MPVMAGIWTSAIKQSVSARRGDSSSPAADGKVSTVKPSDRMSLRMDARRKLSSSTIETNGALDMRPPGARLNPRCRRQDLVVTLHARPLRCVNEGCRAMPSPRKLWLIGRGGRRLSLAKRRDVTMMRGVRFCLGSSAPELRFLPHLFYSYPRIAAKVESAQCRCTVIKKARYGYRLNREDH